MKKDAEIKEEREYKQLKGSMTKAWAGEQRAVMALPLTCLSVLCPWSSGAHYQGIYAIQLPLQVLITSKAAPKNPLIQINSTGHFNSWTRSKPISHTVSYLSYTLMQKCRQEIPQLILNHEKAYTCSDWLFLQGQRMAGCLTSGLYFMAPAPALEWFGQGFFSFPPS